MKKSIYRWVALSTFVTLSISCNKKLVEYNPSGSTIEALLTTPEGFETAINGAYSYNRSFYGKEEGLALFEAGTDLWAPSAKIGNTSIIGLSPNTPISTYNGIVSDNPWILTNLWQPCYAGINLCNTALSYIEQANLSASRRPSAEAELRFLRGWYYFLLVQSYGAVNFTLDPTTGMVTTANRTAEGKIYEQVVADMRFAADNLPATQKDYGRVTKVGALAVLSKVLLTKGDYQDASNTANSVIKDFGLNLMGKYSDLWTMDNESNSEVLWAVNYAKDISLNAGSNISPSLFLMAYSDLPGMTMDIDNGLPEGRWIPTLRYLNLFDETKDSRYDATFKQAWIANNAATLPKWTAADAAQNPALSSMVGQNKFNVGDTAIFLTKYAVNDFDQNYTVRYRYKTLDKNDLYNANGTVKNINQYISLKKFDDPTRATALERQSSRNADVIRLGEVYLIAAEAQVKLGKTDSAAYFVNIVRTRAAKAGKEVDMKVSSADMTVDFILDERARELGGEQMRWFDLKRTGKLIERVTAYNPDISENIKPFHVLRPIPLAQINAVTNKEDFKQNDGY